MKQHLFEYTHTDGLGNETDFIEYDVNGCIVTWKLYSDFLHDWVDVGPFAIKVKWPVRFEAMQEIINSQFNLTKQAKLDAKADEESA